MSFFSDQIILANQSFHKKFFDKITLKLVFPFARNAKCHMLNRNVEFVKVATFFAYEC